MKRLAYSDESCGHVTTFFSTLRANTRPTTASVIGRLHNPNLGEPFKHGRQEKNDKIENKRMKYGSSFLIL